MGLVVRSVITGLSLIVKFEDVDDWDDDDDDDDVDELLAIDAAEFIIKLFLVELIVVTLRVSNEKIEKKITLY